MKNNRTFLEKLLDGAEVEWKPLGNVAKLTRGRVMSKEYLSENRGSYSVYSSQTANNGEIGKINSFDFEGEFVSWTTDGANAGTVFYRSGKFSITNVCGLIKISNTLELNYKFLFYWLSIEAKKHVYSGMGNPKLMSHQMEKIPVPIPPLSVQIEIVKILDALTALTSELTSELILRQKQYEYYREKLLSEEELGKVGVQWKALGEIVPISRGKRLIRSQLKDNDQYPVYQNSLQPLGYYDHKNCRAYMTFVIAAGAAGEIGFSNVEFWAADDCYYFDCANKILHDKFLYYFLLSNKHLLTNQVRKASVPRLSRVSIEKIKIPIVSFKEQERIVAILDKFETLTHSITEGLPLAIEQSQKRYEYYRELLLNFPGRE